MLTSIDPRPLDPQVAIFVYQGYLGLDSGIPQSVYSLDRDQIDRGRLDQRGRGEPAVGRVDDAARRHDGGLHRLPGVRRAAALARPGPGVGARRRRSRC